MKKIIAIILLTSSSCFAAGANKTVDSITFGRDGTVQTTAFTVPVSSLSAVVGAGSCTNCNATFNAQGQVTTFSNGSAGGGGATLPLPPGDTNYIQVTLGSIQNAAFFTSSGTTTNFFASTIAVSAGSVTNPSVQFSTTCGIYRSAADQMSFTNASSETFRTTAIGALVMVSSSMNSNSQAGTVYIRGPTGSTINNHILRFAGNSGASDSMLYMPASSSDLRFAKTDGTTTTDLMTVPQSGTLKLNTYGAGTGQFDSSGNLTSVVTPAFNSGFSASTGVFTSTLTANYKIAVVGASLSNGNIPTIYNSSTPASGIIFRNGGATDIIDGNAIRVGNFAITGNNFISSIFVHNGSGSTDADQDIVQASAGGTALNYTRMKITNIDQSNAYFNAFLGVYINNLAGGGTAYFTIQGSTGAGIIGGNNLFTINISSGSGGYGNVAIPSGSLTVTSGSTQPSQITTGLTVTGGPAILQGDNVGAVALTGNYGEKKSSAAFTAINLPATTNWGDLVSVALTTGAWNITLQECEQAAGATITSGGFIAISTSSGNNAGGLNYPDNEIELSLAATTDGCGTISGYLINLSANQTIYGKMEDAYAAGQPTMKGIIRAIRAY